MVAKLLHKNKAIKMTPVCWLILMPYSFQKKKKTNWGDKRFKDDSSKEMRLVGDAMKGFRLIQGS